MNAVRHLMNATIKSGFRLRLHEGRVQVAPRARAPVKLLQLLGEHQEEIAFELSRFCTTCDCPNAPFGFGFDYRNPNRTKWFCSYCVKTFDQKKCNLE